MGMGMRMEFRPRKDRSLKGRCKAYIEKTYSLPEAQELAKNDGFSANTSVWLSAFAETLGGKFLPH